jgi:chromosome partitioning protein
MEIDLVGENNQVHINQSKTAKKKIFKKYKDSTFSVVQLADLFGVSRPHLYELGTLGVLKNPLILKKGSIEVSSYGWDAIESLSKYFSKKIIKPKERKIKVFFNRKGGVGKSTLSAQFIMRAAAQGLKTLAIDMDSQGHLSKLLHFSETELALELNKSKTFLNTIIGDKPSHIKDVIVPITPLLDLIPANDYLSLLDMELFLKPNREKRIIAPIRSLRDSYDLIVIDANASLSMSNQILIMAADEICIPTKTDRLSIDGLSLIFNALQRLEEEYSYSPSAKIIANLFDIRELESQESLGLLREGYSDILLPTVVRKNSDIPNAQSENQAIWQYKRNSSGSEDIIAMTKHLLTEE